MIRISILSLFIIYLAIGSIGCYTMISHPDLSETRDAEQEWLDSHVGHVDDCASCHEDHQQSRPVSSLGIVLPDDGYDYYDWEYYYGNSWWTDDYYSVKNSERNSTPLPPTTQRTFTRSSPQTGPSNSMTGRPSSLSKSTGGASKSQSTNTSSGKRTGTRRNIDQSKRKAKKTSSAQSKKQE